MNAVEKKCRTCRHWNIPADKRAMAYSMYSCSAPCPDLSKIVPESIYKGVWGDRMANPHRSYMCRDGGTNCPTWEARKP